MQSRYTSLSIAVPHGEPPSEFRLFTAGAVETTKGTFTFDATSAESVMADYVLQGNELMIDYDHASLAQVTLDPALAGKAAGWFSLEVRNGELWAVNVRWTQPAADALRRKEWRYMSPAFETVDGHITSLLNCAITNLPATRKLQPLMAASMKPENVMAALEALIAGDHEKCAELLKGIIAEAAGAAAPADPAAEPAPEAAQPEATAADPAAAPAPEGEEKEKEEELIAAHATVSRLSGKSFVLSIGDVERWHASHLELETERAKLAKDRAILESAERRQGCIDLVVKANRAPSTVWENADCSAPKSYLASMPIADFRNYVVDAVKASGKKPALVPPKKAGAGAVGVHGLTAEQASMCAETGCDPATFAMLKARTTSK